MTDKPEPHQFPEFTPSGDDTAESEQEYQKRIKAGYAALFTAEYAARVEAGLLALQAAK